MNYNAATLAAQKAFDAMVPPERTRQEEIEAERIPSLRDEALDRLIDTPGWTAVDDLIEAGAFANEVIANCAMATPETAYAMCMALRAQFAALYELQIDSMIEPALRAAA